MKLSIVIPFFQREPGILRRTLASVLAQRGLPAAAEIEMIVVDDGSPVPACAEAAGLGFGKPFALTLLAQANTGVAGARNAGLRAVGASTDYVAFLDSDDTWREDHLARGLRAMALGYDLFFADNVRPGHHDSQLMLSDSGAGLLRGAPDRDGLTEVTPDALSCAILRDCPCQISSVMFRRAAAPDLRFDTSMRAAGEDLIFLWHLAGKARRVALCRDVTVRCGRGINMYFSNIGWRSPGHLARLVDDTRSRQRLLDSADLPAEERAWHRKSMAFRHREIAAAAIGCFLRSKGRWPPELKLLSREDRSFYRWFPLAAVQVALAGGLRPPGTETRQHPVMVGPKGSPGTGSGQPSATSLMHKGKSWILGLRRG